MKMSEIIKYVEIYSVKELLKLGLQSYFETEESDLDDLRNRYATHEFRRIAEPLEYFENSINDIKNNIKEYEWLYSILADEQSKIVLEHMLTAKLKFDTTEIEKAFSMEEIYFDKKIWGNLENEYYVDCGAFKGDTIIQFTINCPDFSKIYAFEAVSRIMDICRNEVNDISAVVPNTIVFYNYAVSDESKKLYFDVGMMQGESRASEQGDVEVEATSLDEIVASPISFIKMDIEGSELQAIQGAKRIIQENTPKMAICIYHKCDDFWKIPKQISQFNANYRYKIRQHNYEVYSETVLYCIPTTTISYESKLNVSSEAIEKRFNLAMDKCLFFTKHEAKKIFDFLNTRKWYLKMLMHQTFEIQQLMHSNMEQKQWAKELERSKSWLGNQLNEQKDYIADLLAGKEWLEQQCKKHEIELNNQTAYISDLLSAKDWLENQANEHEEYIADLLEGKEWLKNQCENLDIELKNKDAYIADLSEAKMWLENQNNEQLGELDESHAYIDSLEKHISELENEKSKLRYQLNTLKDDKLIQKIIKMKKYQV